MQAHAPDNFTISGDGSAETIIQDPTDLKNAKDNNGIDLDLNLEAKTSAFEATEREMQDILVELSSDEGLMKFRLEYEKSFRNIKKSHDQEKRLIKKCKEINAEMLNSQAKIKTALRLSQEDQKTITHLQKEVEKTWRLVHVSQEKELHSKEVNDQMKEEIGNLTMLVERGVGINSNQSCIINEVKAEKDEMKHQLDEQEEQVKLMENQLRDIHSQREDAKRQADDKTKIIDVLTENIRKKDDEMDREQRRRERIGKELLEVRGRLDVKLQHEDNMTTEVHSAQIQIEHLTQQLSDAKTTIEKYVNDYESLLDRTRHLAEDLRQQISKNDQLHTTNTEAENDMRLANAEVSHLKTDKWQVERNLDRERQRNLDLVQQLDESKTPLLVSKAENERLLEEIEHMRRKEHTSIREIELMEREKEVQQKSIFRSEQKTSDLEEVLVEQKEVARSLEGTTVVLNKEIIKLGQSLFKVEREKQSIIIEVAEEKRKAEAVVEQLRLKDIELDDYVKTNEGYEKRLRGQQMHYDQVINERNQVLRKYADAEDEIAEEKRKQKTLEHQIEQLKTEIELKDQALLKEHFDHERVQKVKSQYESDLLKKDKLLDANHELIRQQESEIRNVVTMSKRMDEEGLLQRKEYDQLINERDILGTQLIRRNDELALLYEKLKIQQSTLKRGEAQYNQRIQDIKLLKAKVKDLNRQLRLSEHKTRHVHELEREIQQAQKELLQERTKVKALSEELENPINVHRWRKLEGADPTSYDLVQKVQLLQRRLILKTEEAVEKDGLLQEKEQLICEMKAMIARHPGPEVAEQLVIYQSTLKDKTRQLKAMASEINMLQAQANEYKYEIERLSRELQETKRRMYERKRIDQMLLESSDADDLRALNIEKNSSAPPTAPTASPRQMDISDLISSTPIMLGRSLREKQKAIATSGLRRFTGGGFALHK